MTDTVIRVENLGKQYRIGVQEKAPRSLQQAVTSLLGSPFKYLNTVLRPPTNEEIVWALKDVSFEVKQGEVIGVIGRNGAGKSTLLKILSRITEPTTGYAEIRGRVASLLEVGAGFHPELTGRENIYLNGTIMGMKKREIDRRFDEIVDFAEVEKFIDTPVKRYSSGMYVRLAFAVAAHLNAEILVVDEVLAVGDATFQKKCLGKIGDVASQEGRTVLFVSHNMGVISQLCSRALWVDAGYVKRDDLPSDVIESYLSIGTRTKSEWYRPNTLSKTDSYLKTVRILNLENLPTSVIEFRQSCKIEIQYCIEKPTRDLAILCQLLNAQGISVFTTWDTDTTSWGGQTREVGDFKSVCHIPDSLLKPGFYWLTIGILVPNVMQIEYHTDLVGFEVSAAGYPFNLDRLGVIMPLIDWKVTAL